MSLLTVPGMAPAAEAEPEPEPCAVVRTVGGETLDEVRIRIKRSLGHQGAIQTWSTRSFWGQAPRYEKMLRCLFGPRAKRTLAALGEAVDPSDADALALALVNLSDHVDATLQVVCTMVESEFASHARFPSTILRGNSLASKAGTLFCKRVGKEYLRKTLGACVEAIIADGELSLEIDPNKLARAHPNASDDELASLQTQQQSMLLSLVTSLFERIVSPESIAGMPLAIREIASYISQMARKYLPRQVAASDRLRLVGGFVMLRFFNPAIVTPESFDVVSEDGVPGPKARRNLVLITKVLQNLSNQVLFGSKETHMSIMNSFIGDNQDRMAEYLDAIIDLDGHPPSVEALSATAGASSSSSVAAGANPEWDVHALECDDLFSLHYVLLNMLPALTFSFECQPIGEPQPEPQPEPEPQRKPEPEPDVLGSGSGNGNGSGGDGADGPERRESQLDAETVSEFDNLLDQFVSIEDGLALELGLESGGGGEPEPEPAPEPASAAAATPDPEPAPEPVVRTRTESQRASDSEFLSAIMDLGPAPMVARQTGRANKNRSKSQSFASDSSVASSEDISLLHAEAAGLDMEMASARFFYRGLPNRDGIPVYYLIMSQLQVKFMADVDELAAFVRNTMGSDIDEPYALVIDMSWVKLTFEMKRLVYKQLSTFASIFNRQQKKNSRALYLIHPSSFTSTVLYLASRFTSAKFRRKIHEIYEWEALHEYIAPANVALPESSKGYLTKSYEVVKINAKGKEQDRVIKFTHNSILNIDPKTQKIRNERLLTEMSDIAAPRSEPTIVLQFNLEDGGAGTTGSSSFFSKFRHNDADSEFRTYRFGSIEERNEIIFEIFVRGFSAPAFPHANQFDVQEQRGTGRKNTRTLKLTIDSVLTVAKGRIKKEVAFAGIESVALDHDNSSVVWLQYKGEKEPTKLFTQDAQALVAAFEHCISANVAADNRESELEKERLNNMALQ